MKTLFDCCCPVSTKSATEVSKNRLKCTNCSLIATAVIIMLLALAVFSAAAAVMMPTVMGGLTQCSLIAFFSLVFTFPLCSYLSSLFSPKESRSTSPGTGNPSGAMTPVTPNMQLGPKARAISVIIETESDAAAADTHGETLTPSDGGFGSPTAISTKQRIEAPPAFCVRNDLSGANSPNKLKPSPAQLPTRLATVVERRTNETPPSRTCQRALLAQHLNAAIISTQQSQIVSSAPLIAAPRMALNFSAPVLTNHKTN